MGWRRKLPPLNYSLSRRLKSAGAIGVRGTQLCILYQAHQGLTTVFDTPRPSNCPPLDSKFHQIRTIRFYLRVVGGSRLKLYQEHRTMILPILEAPTVSNSRNPRRNLQQRSLVAHGDFVGTTQVYEGFQNRGLKMDPKIL